MKAEYINPFLTSMVDVIKTMAQIDLTPGAPSKKQESTASGDVSGVIGMVGNEVKGSLAITIEESLVLQIYSNMLGEKAEKIDDQVTDMVGEITNMVCGGAKRILAENGYDFDLATPTVISGSSHSIHHKVDGLKLLMPFSADSGKAYIEICFDK